VAEAVMRMSEPQAVYGDAPHIQLAYPMFEEDELRRQPIEEEEEELQRQPIEEEEEELQAKTTSCSIPEVQPDIKSHIQSLKGGGQPLSEQNRAFFEQRFGHDFSQVRVHTDTLSAEAARAVNARAFTVGKDVVFGGGEYKQGTVQGRRLLAHELAHTIQQSNNTSRLQRITFDNCSSERQWTIRNAQSRAIDMLNNAITKLGTYNGTIPADVRTALDSHFHATSSAFAGWIRFNLRYLKMFVDLPQYECQNTQSRPNPAWTRWCIPFTDILLYPNWFGFSTDVQARILIHEWVHHYGCNFDLGYRESPGYPGHGTIRSLLNADPWAWLVYDIR